jgi:hypothetical protein
MSGGKSASAISREIIENDLIEEFHWLPQDIAKIPYKRLQMFYLIRKTKSYARGAKTELDSMRRQQAEDSKGGGKGKKNKKITL